MFHKIVVANRGAVAARVLRALGNLNIRSVAVYSEADADAPYLANADEAYCIGPAPARESYLNQDKLLQVVRDSHADGLHPGYGFLSENAEFARKVNALGACFVGPSAQWIDAMGHKTRARDLAAQHGLPVGRGSPVLSDDQYEMMRHAQHIGFPLLVKPAGGGGGIGMLVANDASELPSAVERARSMAQRGFANPEVYLEKYLARPRHIEFQLLGDRHGNVRHLFDRDCSMQRRHQKVVEEASAPLVDRTRVDELAQQIANTFAKMGYDNIGTVEMLMGADGTFSFLEMNTRLQVEHGVTEAITGVDLVAAQIRSAAGLRLDDILPPTLHADGHAIEARVYAEDSKRFLPSPGRLTTFRPPEGSGIRVETGYAEGRAVTMHYDPLLAKVIAHGPSRAAAIQTLREALRNFSVAGVKTNLAALDIILGSSQFRDGEVHTGLLSQLIA
ncbi:biotin carboxylase N-terminal domain-containing protein [Pandoraea sp.]|uniref:acetyl-CoA carboxylase biotin carboxylase subunit n=1 Tax=Pandoraea sp. TaxID=1883445 RepID=UPI0011FEC794|nr:biotin carboxylase N-terminal domain-containing protein [Pandoraea sp.]TAL57072.1 MAG: ATP-grasp domain-containing protein [Pandoraea sp.]TAM18114.1 MAG: ATP-grasp domain-containing protein [Pandoraea sp.]